MDESVYDRQSNNTPLLGKMRRNISNNNSVYSSKSHRVLKSSVSSRSRVNPSKEKNVDTGLLNEIELSNGRIPDFGEKHQTSISNELRESNGFEIIRNSNHKVNRNI